MGNVIPKVLFGHVNKVGFCDAASSPATDEVEGEILGVVCLGVRGFAALGLSLVGIGVGLRVLAAHSSRILLVEWVERVIITPVISFGMMMASAERSSTQPYKTAR